MKADPDNGGNPERKPRKTAISKALAGRIPGKARGGVRKQGAAYQGAVEAVFAMLIAIGIGYWLDQRFGTLPLGIFAGVGLGFTAFVVRLLRLRKLLEPPEDGADDGEA